MSTEYSKMYTLSGGPKVNIDDGNPGQQGYTTPFISKPDGHCELILAFGGFRAARKIPGEVADNKVASKTVAHTVEFSETASSKIEKVIDT